MIAIDLARQLRERIATDFNVESIDKDNLVVYMPFIYDDGDQFSINLSRDGANWRLTDDGDSLKRAMDLGFDSKKESNSDRLNKLIEFYGVEDEDGELTLKTEDDNLVDSLFTLTQSCLEATWLARTPKPRSVAERQNFDIKLDRLIKRAIPSAKVIKGWNDPKCDPKRLYPIDAHIEGKRKQLFLFGVPNLAACMRATITCQHYKIEGADFEAVAIYDHEEALTKRYTDQLNEVVGKRFPRISERNAIATFLQAAAL